MDKIAISPIAMITAETCGMKICRYWENPMATVAAETIATNIIKQPTIDAAKSFLNVFLA